MSATPAAILDRPSLTRLLAALVALLAIATTLAGVRLGAARDAALASERDYELCQADLRDLRAWQGTTGASGDATAANPELNRRIRQAATTAGIGDQLASIEPGTPTRARDSDALRTPIFLRLDGVTLRQVVTFVHELTAADASLRATGLEFATPPPGAGPVTIGQELWTADLTLSESGVAPRAERSP